MPDPADEQLRTLLSAEPPASVLALPAHNRAQLAELLASARRRQGEDLKAAFTASLRHVPFPVRGIVRKVLLG